MKTKTKTYALDFGKQLDLIAKHEVKQLRKFHFLSECKMRKSRPKHKKKSQLRNLLIPLQLSTIPTCNTI